MTEIADQVIRVLATQARCDPGSITPATSVDDLGLDSLGLVEAIFAIEERFAIAIPFGPNAPEAAGAGFRTVGDLVAEVARLSAQPAG